MRGQIYQYLIIMENLSESDQYGAIQLNLTNIGQFISIWPIRANSLIMINMGITYIHMLIDTHNTLRLKCPTPINQSYPLYGQSLITLNRQSIHKRNLSGCHHKVNCVKLQTSFHFKMHKLWFGPSWTDILLINRNLWTATDQFLKKL